MRSPAGNATGGRARSRQARRAHAALTDPLISRGAGEAYQLRDPRISGRSLFENKFPGEELGPAKIVPPDALGRVSGRFNYVVTQDGEFVVGRRFDTAGGGHIDLAGARPVQAGGEVKVVQGEIKYIDNTSGHCQPSGSAAQQAAEQAFRGAGFDAAGKYVE